jgi:hypothetical protein
MWQADIRKELVVRERLEVGHHCKRLRQQNQGAGAHRQRLAQPDHIYGLEMQRSPAHGGNISISRASLQGVI